MTTETNEQRERAELIRRLRQCADDPMWSDHTEISKRTLLRAVNMLSADAQRPALKPLTDEEVDRVLERHAGGADWLDAEYRSAYKLARAIEAAHGIKEKA